MSERHWEEEQRSVLGRLLDSIFGRREALEEKIDNESVGCAHCNSKADKISRITSPLRGVLANGPNRPART
jgi:hypothetical protein